MDCANSSGHQQFCLRWHNHQASLLSTLPLLLDQSHLTDVTLSAGGKTLQAHRVVLSACSTFFSELFRTLDSSLHPVIVIPGASVGTLVALLTFMYSGEVNVYEEQIPTLLAIAETLGIKGLADFQSNNSSKVSSSAENSSIKDTSYSVNPLAIKIPSPLENFFIKSFHLLPNLMPQPLNFSQTALNKTSEILSRYYQHCNVMQQTAKDEQENQTTEKTFNKDILNDESKFTKDVKKIDKIAENLRCTNSNGMYRGDSTPVNTSNVAQSLLVGNKSSYQSVAPHLLVKKKVISKNDIDGKESVTNEHVLPHFNMSENLEGSKYLHPITPQQKPASSKLYATCFICHKQLSNQYNLRVHLETHQNIRYACNVCSHVSRSKDALRKHVSYRHPGAPSPCETETRRKRPKPTPIASAPVEMIKPEIDETRKNAQSNISNHSPHRYIQSNFQSTIQYPPNTCENTLNDVNSNVSNLDQPRST